MHHDSTDHGDEVAQTPFAIVPCWIAPLGQKAILAYFALACHASSVDRSCRPKVATLAGCAGMGATAMREGIALLVEAGAVTVEERYAEDGSRRSNLYHLHADPPTATRRAPHRDAVDPPPPHGGLKNQTVVGPEQTPDGVCESETPRADVEEVVTALAAHVRTATTREPNVTKQWRRDVRLMLDGPGKSPPEWSVEQLLFVIQWLDAPTRDAQFWSPNVLCPAKLRAQMPKLVAAIRRERQGGNGNGVADRIAGIRAAAAGPRGTLAEQMAAMRATVAP